MFFLLFLPYNQVNQSSLGLHDEYGTNAGQPPVFGPGQSG